MTSTSRLLAGVALASFAQPAFAQDTPPAPATTLTSPDASGGTDDTIIITGVRGGQARTVADSPVPIDVVSRRELQATGRTGLKEILGNIVPSLTMPALGGGGTSASVKPIAIRGLSGDYLLMQTSIPRSNSRSSTCAATAEIGRTSSSRPGSLPATS